MNIIIKNAPGLLGIVLLTGCTCHRSVVHQEPMAMMRETSSEITPAANLMNNIYFAFDRYNLSESSKNTLRGNAAWLQEHKNVDVKIDGHTDERGTTEYNILLGKNRAQAASTYLRSLGVDARRINTTSFGEELPVDPNHNEAAWGKNRRDEFIALTSDLPLNERRNQVETN